MRFNFGQSLLSFCSVLTHGGWGGVVGLGILGGRTSADATRLSIPLVDAGVSQLCLVTLLFGAGVLAPPLAFAVIIGALFLEITAPIRFKFTTVTFPN